MKAILGKPIGELLAIAIVQEGPRADWDPTALFRDWADQLFIGFIDREHGDAVPGKPLRHVSSLDGLRWVRDEICRRNVKLPDDEPFLLDVAIRALEQKNFEISCELRSRVASHASSPKAQPEQAKVQTERN